MSIPIALQECKTRRIDFAYAFRYQYVVGPDRLELPGFRVESLGGYWIHSGTSLERTVLKDGSGAVFGLVLGIAVDHNGATPDEITSRLIPQADWCGARKTFEKYVTLLSGRYAIIARINGQTYFYCDPVGMIGAVTAYETRRIASSPGLCIDRAYSTSDLYDVEAMSEGRGTFGFAHTIDRHVFRHNANHRFNIDHFSASRFWPTAKDSFEIEERQYHCVYDEVIGASRRVISRITRLHETALPLSGGNDSRLVLAVADDDSRNRLCQTFTHINNYANRRDSEVASKLCAAVGLEHSVHDRKKIPTPRFQAATHSRIFRVASGSPSPVPKEIRNGLFCQVRKGSIVMRGHQCNIFRGQYLTTSDTSKWTEASWQIRMMQLVGSGEYSSKVATRFTPDFMKYYRDLPDCALKRSADFIFLETLVPAALGPLFTGQPYAFYLSPFNSRRLIQLFMQPDTSYRMSNQTTHELVLRADKRLFALAYNYDLPSDMRDSGESFGRRVKRCQSIVENYRRHFGQSPPEVKPQPHSPSQ